MTLLPKRLKGILSARYRYLGIHFAGGQCDVYLCNDEHLERQVVLKVPGAGVDLTMLERATIALGQLGSKHIARTQDMIREDDGKLCAVVEEYVDGPDLDTVYPGAIADVRELLLVFWQLTDALEHIHNAGLVHHDLKGKNVKRDSAGILKLFDFGMSRRGTSVTVSTFGTPGYTAPEVHYPPRIIEPPIDLWSIGALAWRFCTGALHPELTKLVPSTPSDSLGIARPDLPDAVAGMLDQCLELRSIDRPTSGQLREALADALLHNLHHGVLFQGETPWLVSAATPTIALKWQNHRFSVRYDGHQFVVRRIEGEVMVNNIAVATELVLPGSCVISLGPPANPWDRTHIPFHASHPEVIL